MKRISRITAVIMTVAIIIACFAVPSFAAGKKNYLLLGDSIAVGQGLANSNDACYGKIVAHTNGYNYYNTAISGTPSSVLLALLDADYMIEDVKKADIIQISIGGNDFLTSNTVTLFIGGMMGIDTQFDSIQKKFEKNFAGIISKINKLNPRATILVQTLYNPCGNAFSYVYQKGVDRINNTIKSYQKNYGRIQIVDVESAFKGHAREYIAIDTIHPNTEGNLAIAKVTLSKLKALGLGSSTTPVINNPGVNWTSIKPSNVSTVISYYINLVSKYIDIILK